MKCNKHSTVDESWCGTVYSFHWVRLCCVFVLPPTTTTLLTRAPSRRASQLKLLVKGEAVVELTGRVLSWFGHFFDELFSLNNGFQDFALVGLAEHAANKHFKENEERFVQRKDQVEFADCFVRISIIKYLVRPQITQSSSNDK